MKFELIFLLFSCLVFAKDYINEAKLTTVFTEKALSGEELKVIEVRTYKLEDGSTIMIVLVEEKDKKLFKEGELRKAMEEAWEKVEKKYRYKEYLDDMNGLKKELELK